MGASRGDWYDWPRREALREHNDAVPVSLAEGLEDVLQGTLATQNTLKSTQLTNAIRDAVLL